MKAAEFKRRYIAEIMPRFNTEKDRHLDNLDRVVADLERMILQLEDGCACGGTPAMAPKPVEHEYPKWRDVWDKLPKFPDLPSAPFCEPLPRYWLFENTLYTKSPD